MLPKQVTSKTLLFLAVSALGVSSMMTQLVMMRELLAVFSGNEMIFGIVLGNWLLVTGLGAMAGKTCRRLKHPITFLVLAQIVIAVLPLVEIVLLRSLRNVIFIRGALIGPADTVVACFVLLLPYGLIAGYLLPLACRVLARGQDAGSIGQVYFLDVIGDIVGGLLFTFVMVHFFPHFWILVFPAFLNLFFAVLLAGREKKTWLAGLTALVGIGLTILLLTTDPDCASMKQLYEGQQIVYRGNSPYGNLVVTESAGQYNFIENGVPLFSTHNIEETEETVHFAMAQRPRAKRVLIISGGISGTAREILKYPVERVDYVELDPLIVKVGKKYVPRALSDPRIHVIQTDGRGFVKRTARRYDVVIADVPDPSTSQINRFYTREFFREVKKILTPRGVLSLTLGHYENYMSRELARLVSVTNKTLHTQFHNVLILPAGQIFFLASEGELTLDIAERLKQNAISTLWVRRDYLRGVLTPDRLADVKRATAEAAGVNRDFSPVLYYDHLRYWISQFKLRLGALEAVLLLGLAIYLFRIRPVSFAVFTTGFAASGLELVLLLGFQILYGSVYHQVGLIITTFMAGLAVGAFLMNRMPKKGRACLIKLEIAVAVFAVALPFMLMALGQLGPGPMMTGLGKAAFIALTLVLATLTGMEFPLAGRADFVGGVSPTASKLYTADFLGAALAALLVSTLLIPLLGVTTICLLIAALNLFSGARMMVADRRRPPA